MTPKLTLYSRRDCCLCDEMKTVIQQVAARTALQLVEIDVDSEDDLKAKYGSEVPVLFIDGQKAFKYRLTAAALTKRLNHNTRPILSRLGRILGKESS
jgi:glutaredoxin